MSTIKAQLAAAEARYRTLLTRSRELDTKRETRRKIIYGAAFLNMVEQMPPAQRADLVARVHRRVVRDVDRTVLDLMPLPAPMSQVATLTESRRRAADEGDSGQGLLPM